MPVQGGRFFDAVREINQRTGGEQRRQPVLSIVFQAAMALCRSMRRRVWGTGGFGGTQL